MIIRLMVAQRQKNIIVVEDIEKLGDVLLQYEKYTTGLTSGLQHNNEVFCSEFEEIINGLVK